MTTKSEREQKAFEEAEQMRADRMQQEADRQTHLVDPMTHPSNGDPPPAISPAGDRLGVVPVTRNAVADHAQAEQEGIEAAKDSEPSKAEKAASKPKHKPAAKKSSASDSKVTADASKTEKIAAKRDEADEKNQPPGSAADAVPSWMPFGGSTSDKQ